VKLWDNDEPFFPATLLEHGKESRQFEVAGLKRECWSSASPIRSIFKDAFERAGVPYFNEHSFRDTVVQLGETICKSPEDFKAWSQNLGHSQVLTTFLSYGEVAPRRQGEIIQGLGRPQTVCQSNAEEIAEAVIRKMKATDSSNL
jgi:integrase